MRLLGGCEPGPQSARGPGGLVGPPSCRGRKLIAMLQAPVEDVLTRVIAAYGVRAMLTDDAKYCGQWRDVEPASSTAYLHLIDQGRCLMSGPFAKQPLQLGAGDFVVLPHGAAHDLASCAGAKVDDYTTMLCGTVEFTHGARNPLLKALPDVIVVRGAEGGERFRQLGQLLCDEIRGGGFGGRGSRRTRAA